MAPSPVVAAQTARRRESLPRSPTAAERPDTVHPAPSPARPGPAGASWAERGRRASPHPAAAAASPDLPAAPAAQSRGIAQLSLPVRLPGGWSPADTPGRLRSRLDGGLRGDRRESRLGALPEVRRRALPPIAGLRGRGAGWGARSRRCGDGGGTLGGAAPAEVPVAAGPAPGRRCGAPARRPLRPLQARAGAGCGAGRRPRWELGRACVRGGGAATGDAGPGAALLPFRGEAAPPAPENQPGRSAGWGPGGPLSQTGSVRSPRDGSGTGPGEPESTCPPLVPSVVLARPLCSAVPQVPWDLLLLCSSSVRCPGRPA